MLKIDEYIKHRTQYFESRGIIEKCSNKQLIDSVVNVQANPTVEVTGQRIIYIYSDCDRKFFKKYKVGETRGDPHYRVRSQDKSNSSSEPELIAYFWSPFSSDKKIHKFLPNHIRKEWFVLENPIEDVRMAIMQSDWSAMNNALMFDELEAKRNLLNTEERMSKMNLSDWSHREFQSLLIV